MRDEGLRLLAKGVVESKVYLMATKDFKLKILKKWYDDARIDWVVMNKIMFKLNNKPLPSKSSYYKECFEHKW